MKRIFVFSLLLLQPLLHVYGQEKLQLSDKHLNKINLESNPVKKFLLYKKFYRKDSIRHSKESDRFWKQKGDSIGKHIIAVEKALKIKQRNVKDEARGRLYNLRYIDWAKHQSDTQLKLLKANYPDVSPSFSIIMRNYFNLYFLAATQNDSILVVVKNQLPDLVLARKLKTKLNNYEILNPEKTRQIQQLSIKGLTPSGAIGNVRSWQGKAQKMAGEFDKYGDILSRPDTLITLAKVEGGKFATEQLANLSGFDQIGELKRQIAQADMLKGEVTKYQSQLAQLQDSAYIKGEAKKRAEELATDYVADHPEVMQDIQRKVAVLMKKYSVVPNSNDLSSAVKRTSLKGKRFRDHIVIATNFQLLSITPLSIDFSPQVGYKFNRKFVLGTGLTYRQTFSDSVPTLSPQVFGYKAFISYDVINNFFAYSEFGRNSPGFKQTEDGRERVWKNAFFLGVGRRFMIHPKIEMTLVLCYNFLNEQNDPIYPKPWSIRVGFQTSELAFLKGSK